MNKRIVLILSLYCVTLLPNHIIAQIDNSRNIEYQWNTDTLNLRFFEVKTQEADTTIKYNLNIKNYLPDNEYLIRIKLINKAHATGTFHIYKKTKNLLNFYIAREDELKPGKSISEWAVIGVAPKHQKRRAFAYYLERERARCCAYAAPGSPP